MNSAATPAEVLEFPAAVVPPIKTKERLLALDVFRGMTLVAMATVNMPGEHGLAYAPLAHVSWNGWTIADLIFPFFIFIVGVAMPYSFSGRLARGDSKSQLVGHILVRALVLFSIGVFMNWYTNYMGGLPRYHLANIRIFGALQRIALCYLFASLLYLTFKARGLAIIASTLLVLYFVLLKFIPAPGHLAPVLAKDGNWVQFVDLHLMPGHLASSTWEPKGWLGTFPAVATMLIGVLAGIYLRSPRSAMEKVRAFLVAGNLGILLGLLWSVWIPINQNLWTSSLVVFMGGMALVILGCCYYLADVRKIQWWTKPFVIVGSNSLFLWVMGGDGSSVTNLGLVKLHLANGQQVSLKAMIYHHLASWVGPVNGSELYAFLWVLLWIGILTVMYKNKIFVKI